MLPSTPHQWSIHNENGRLGPVQVNGDGRCRPLVTLRKEYRANITKLNWTVVMLTMPKKFLYETERKFLRAQVAFLSSLCDCIHFFSNVPHACRPTADWCQQWNQHGRCSHVPHRLRPCWIPRSVWYIGTVWCGDIYAPLASNPPFVSCFLCQTSITFMQSSIVCLLRCSASSGSWELKHFGLYCSVLLEFLFSIKFSSCLPALTVQGISTRLCRRLQKLQNDGTHCRGFGWSNYPGYYYGALQRLHSRFSIIICIIKVKNLAS